MTSAASKDTISGKEALKDPQKHESNAQLMLKEVTWQEEFLFQALARANEELADWEMAIKRKQEDLARKEAEADEKMWQVMKMHEALIAREARLRAAERDNAATRALLEQQQKDLRKQEVQIINSTAGSNVEPLVHQGSSVMQEIQASANGPAQQGQIQVQAHHPSAQLQMQGPVTAPHAMPTYMQYHGVSPYGTPLVPFYSHAPGVHGVPHATGQGQRAMQDFRIEDYLA